MKVCMSHRVRPRRQMTCDAYSAAVAQRGPESKRGQAETKNPIRLKGLLVGAQGLEPWTR
jgi:hypothetical protein